MLTLPKCLFCVPAVKGVEFGAGFEAAELKVRKTTTLSATGW